MAILSRRTGAAAIAAVVIAYFAHAQYHYNVLKRQLLGSAQPSLYWMSDVHVVTALAPTEGTDLMTSVAALLETVRASSGEVIYVGKVVTDVAKSVSVPHADSALFRVLLVTQWSSIEEFKRFRAASLKSAGSPWELAWSTPWRRTAALNLLLPVGLYVLRLKTAVLQQWYDVTTKGTKAELAEAEGHYDFERFERLATLVEAQVPEAPVLIWNWLLEHQSAEIRARNTRYGLNMMQMLSQHGGGVMDLGSALPPEREMLEDESWRKFETVAAVHYPTISFFVSLIRSRWMQQNVQGKELGDTLALLTVPWAKGLP